MTDTEKEIAERIAAAGKRAAAEAEERRAREAATEVKPKPKEIGGPAGVEPTRFGDWERKGIVSDF